MKLNEKIKTYRKIFDLSQEQLAEKLNVSRQVITKWESDNGLPDIENLKSLSKTFNVSIDYLLNEDEEIFYLFTAQKNPNPFDIFSTCIIALTNKRIMVVQKRVIFGYNLKSVTPDLFNDFSVYKGIIWGKVYIDTVKEFIALSNIDPKALPEIETNLSEYLLRIKENYNPYSLFILLECGKHKKHCCRQRHKVKK